MTNITDDIIKQAAQGDARAFEAIYRSFSSLVYNVSFRILGNQQDAQEVTQDVFINIHRKLSIFRFDSSLKTWIYRITVNTSINYGKKRTREKKQTLPLDEQWQLTANIDEADEPMNKEFNKTVIEKLLNSLNADQRACLVLRSVEGLSYQEISEALNININTVRTRIKRAREALLALKTEVIKNAM